MGYETMTVSQYVAINKIPETAPTFDRELQIASILSGKKQEKIEAMPFDKMIWFIKAYNKLLNTDKRPSKLKRVIWIRGTRYVLKDKIGNFNAEIYLSLIHYRTQGALVNMHNILSWLYFPTFAKHNPEKAAKDLSRVKLKYVCGAFFLYSKILKDWKLLMECSTIISQNLLENHLKVLNETKTQYLNIGDGIIS